MASKEEDDLLKLYMSMPAANVVDSPKPLDREGEDILKMYLPAATLEKAIPPQVRKEAEGLLANRATDSAGTAVAKNIATGALKGIADIPGFVGNVRNFGDYLFNRAESAITGKTMDEVAARHAGMNKLIQENQTPIGKLATAIDPFRVMPSGEDIAKPILARTGEYVPETQAGRMLQAGSQAVTGMFAPGVKSPSVAAVTQSIPSKLAMLPAAGIVGAGAQGVAEATGEPLTGVGVALIPGTAARLGRGAQNQLMGTVDPDTARLAALARDKYNIPITGGQMAGTPFARLLEDVSSRLPFSGASKIAGDQAAAFNSGVGRTFGEAGASKITPDVMARARDRIGADLELVAQHTKIIPDQPLARDFATIIRDAQLGPAGAEQRIQTNIAEIASRIQRAGGVIDGRTYQDLTRTGSGGKGAGLVQKLATDADPYIREAGRALRDALDDALQRHAPPDMANLLSEARGQWKNLRTIEDLVAKAPSGDLSPALLQGRVNAKNKGTYGAAYGGGGDLKELGDIGQAFLKRPPNSMTADRSMILGMLGAMGSAIPAMVSGNPMHAMYLPAAALGGITAGRLAGGLLHSDATANNLIARSLGLPQPGGISNKLLNAALPSALAARQPLLVQEAP